MNLTLKGAKVIGAVRQEDISFVSKKTGKSEVFHKTVAMIMCDGEIYKGTPAFGCGPDVFADLDKAEVVCVDKRPDVWVLVLRGGTVAVAPLEGPQLPARS